MNEARIGHEHDVEIPFNEGIIDSGCTGGEAAGCIVDHASKDMSPIVGGWIR
jgi:hypothetical protein